jgi:hypothetical protein
VAAVLAARAAGEWRSDGHSVAPSGEVTELSVKMRFEASGAAAEDDEDEEEEPPSPPSGRFLVGIGRRTNPSHPKITLCPAVSSK